jgi:hypothetical protein
VKYSKRNSEIERHSISWCVMRVIQRAFLLHTLFAREAGIEAHKNRGTSGGNMARMSSNHMVLIRALEFS